VFVRLDQQVSNPSSPNTSLSHQHAKWWKSTISLPSHTRPQTTVRRRKLRHHFFSHGTTITWRPVKATVDGLQPKLGSFLSYNQEGKFSGRCLCCHYLRELVVHEGLRNAITKAVVRYEEGVASVLRWRYT
jgi:hypothetical protein